MVLQHSLVGYPYFGIKQNSCYNMPTNVGIFSQSYDVIPSFFSCFTTFIVDPYFILKLILNIYVLVSNMAYQERLS